MIWIVVSVIAIMATVVAVSYGHQRSAPHSGPAGDGQRTRNQATATATLPDPRTGPRAAAYRALEAHARALLDGDEAGWLAAVDPGKRRLTEKYKQRFAKLRTLNVTAWSYHSVLEPKPLGSDKIIIDAYIVYCFQDARCKPWNPYATADDTPDTVRVSLVMSERDNRWIIVDDDSYGSVRTRPDPPWFRR